MAKAKREKVNHEAPLIQCFKEVIENDQRFGIKREINIGSDSAICSDIEYISNNDEYLIIEAKSHESKDAYNTRHKIFGQLLKEHGKKSLERDKHKSGMVLAVLVPKDKPASGKSNTKKTGYDFYRDGYLHIPEDLFEKFGKLVKAKYFFVCSIEKRCVDVYTWGGFRKGEAPIHNIVENV